jgi:long-chain acyl-CoA synthetase
MEIRTESHWGRTMRCYAPRPASVDAMFRASVAAHATRTAVVDGDRRLRYGELDATVDRCVTALRARGVGRGDRVAVQLGNRLEFVVAVLACARLGAPVVAAGTRLKQPEVEYLCADSGAVVLVQEAALAAEAPRPEACPALRARIAVDDDPGRDAFGAAIAAAHAAPAPTAAPTEEELFGILYTSGTTGRPKGAMLTHLGVVHSALHWQAVLGLRSSDVSVLPVPASHVAGLCGAVLPLLSVGATLVLVREFKAGAYIELAARERMTHALMVPAMYALCLIDGGLERADLSSWRLGVYGSAPMPEPTIHRLAQVLPALALCNAYGATETTSPATIMPQGLGTAHADSIGRAVPCGELRVLDESGRELPRGEVGELWIAGPMVVPGYWNNPAATAASFPDGGWKSGDVASIDADGFVRLYDRKKDMVNRGGFKVYPAEVESAITEHPEVVEVAVVGRPDPVLGERTVAFVQPRSPALSADALRAFCAARMADYKVPDAVVLTDGPLPRNANGKLQKDVLRGMIASGRVVLPARA